MGLLDKVQAEEILNRLQKINADTKPLWGKMNAGKMMAHCDAAFHAYFDEKKMRQGLMGMLFGRSAKKKLASDKPWPKGLPTSKDFVISDDRTFEEEKQKLISQIERFQKEGENYSTAVHPFFGKMTRDEWSQLFYNHMNHHLTQFGV